MYRPNRIAFLKSTALPFLGILMFDRDPGRVTNIAVVMAQVFHHGHAYRQGGDEYLILVPSLSRRLSVAFLLLRLWGE